MAQYDVGIIGGGPGGYVAAIRAAQLGLKTVLFEKERVGGLCLNWGCIPSKALLRNAEVVSLVRDAAKWGISGIDAPTFDYSSAFKRSRKVVDQLVGGVETLLKENGVTVVLGEAAFASPTTITSNGETYEVANTIIATGATTRMLPGMTADGTRVLTSREALALETAPKSAVIIGGGPIGVEFAHLWSSYGAKVTIVEMLDGLVPLEDPEIGKLLERTFKSRGIESRVKTRVEAAETSDSGVVLTVSKDGQQETLTADSVLIAIGFRPHTESLNLDAVGVALERGFVTIDDDMRTNVPNIYAVGDVTGKLMLAHVAMQQGVCAAEIIAGEAPPPLDYVQMPRATFCEPQVASIGYTEAQAQAAGFATKTGRFPFSALGKAIAVGETAGFAKVVADEATGQVLGVHVIGHDATAVLGDASIASLLEATTVELGFAVQAHPTLSEALKEAALAVNGEAIHIARRRPSRRAK